MVETVRYGLYVEDEDGSLRLDRELTFDEHGSVELNVPTGTKWALGILAEGATFSIAGPYDGPAPSALQRL